MYKVSLPECPTESFHWQVWVTPPITLVSLFTCVTFFSVLALFCDSVTGVKGKKKCNYNGFKPGTENTFTSPDAYE